MFVIDPIGYRESHHNPNSFVYSKAHFIPNYASERIFGQCLPRNIPRAGMRMAERANSIPVSIPDTGSARPVLHIPRNIRFRQGILICGDKLHGGCRPGADQRGGGRNSHTPGADLRKANRSRHVWSKSERRQERRPVEHHDAQREGSDATEHKASCNGDTL